MSNLLLFYHIFTRLTTFHNLSTTRVFELVLSFQLMLERTFACVHASIRLWTNLPTIVLVLSRLLPDPLFKTLISCVCIICCSLSVVLSLHVCITNYSHPCLVCSLDFLYEYSIGEFPCIMPVKYTHAHSCTSS